MAERSDNNVQPQGGADPNVWMVTFGDLIMLFPSFTVDLPGHIPQAFPIRT